MGFYGIQADNDVLPLAQNGGHLAGTEQWGVRGGERRQEAVIGRGLHELGDGDYLIVVVLDNELRRVEG